jgi:hypothetical protein
VRVPGSAVGTDRGAGGDGPWPDVTLQDLWSASDHLPVVVDLLFGSGG